MLRLNYKNKEGGRGTFVHMISRGGRGSGGGGECLRVENIGENVIQLIDCGGWAVGNRKNNPISRLAKEGFEGVG